jgi:hypothetical protein
MSAKYKNIRVLVARSQDAVRNQSCDDVRECDTIKEAKHFARYSLTEAYQQSHETSELMNYAAVMAEEDGRDVCVYDYFRKGYTPPEDPVEAERRKQYETECLRESGY